MIGIARCWLFQIPASAIGNRLAEFPHDDPDRTLLTTSVANTFTQGYNSVLAIRNLEDFPMVVEECHWFLRPFFVEGGAMGLGPRLMGKRNPNATVEFFANELFPEFKFLVYAGWGCWLSKRLAFRQKVSSKILFGLSPLFGGLAIDGWGFADGLLRFSGIHGSRQPPFSENDLRSLWSQGFGRSLWFIFGNRIEELSAEIMATSRELRADIWAGYGLASAFLLFHRVSHLPTPPVQVDDDMKKAYFQGVAFGLIARMHSDSKQFDSWLSQLIPDEKVWVHTTFEQCVRASEELSLLCNPATNYTSWIRAIRHVIVPPICC